MESADPNFMAQPGTD